MKKILITLTLSILTGVSYPQQAPITTVLREEGIENAYPRVSKDGKAVLYQSNRTGNWQLFILDIKSGKSRQLTTGRANNNLADWSPDNRRIGFVSDRDGNEELYLANSDGKGITRITFDTGRDIHPYFSPDGKYLLFNSTRGNGSLDIYRYDLANKKTEQLTNTAANETCARYNPSMSSIVFLKNDDEHDDIYVMNLATGIIRNITNTPFVQDGWPMFNGDGDRIYYSSMETGRYAIYQVQPDGTGKRQLTYPVDNEEDARVYISPDQSIFFNRKNGNMIAILSLLLI